jgi:uncharacterized protein YqhQ
MDFIHGESFPDGVMFNNDRYLSITYKEKNGKIKNKIIEKNPIFRKHPNLNCLPVIHGLINFFEGSINQFIARKQIYGKVKDKNDKISKFSATLSVILILLAGFIIYFLIPTIIAFYLRRYDINYNILYGVEVLFRFLLFILIFVISSLSTNARKTAYFHGAEHKTALCHMNKEEITLENVKKYPIYNPSCGTSLIFTLLMVSIPIFYFINYENIIFRIVIMLILLPILLGVAFDIVGWNGKRIIKKGKIMKSKGFLLQRFNTKQPNEEHLKISISSLTSLLNTDNKN